MVLNEDFREFIRSLNEHGVKYLIVGGYAVAFHGHPRYTKDIDFWIWADEENAEKVIAALSAFGFSSPGLRSEDFLNLDNIIQLGYPPNRIDLITSVSGLDFKEAYQNKAEVRIEDMLVSFIALDDLIKNKRETGRLQDMADAEKLEKQKRKK